MSHTLRVCVGQEKEVNTAAVPAIERYRRDFGLHWPGYMQALLRQCVRGKAQAFRSIVIAGNNEYLNALLQYRLQKVAEQRNGIGRRHRAVINITGNDQRINRMLGAQAVNLRQDMTLVFQQGNAV
jgi:hypothetical protein